MFNLLFLLFSIVTSPENLVYANTSVIFSDNRDYSNYTNEFEFGDTVYVRVETDNLTNTDNRNEIRILKTNGDEILTDSFDYNSGKLTTEFNFPEEKEIYLVEIKVEDSNGHKVYLNTSVSTKYNFKKSRTFEDNKFKNEQDTFNNDSDLFYKGYLGSFEANNIELKVQNSEGEQKQVETFEVSERNNWLELDILSGNNPYLYKEGLYSLVIKDKAQGVKLYKHFYIDQINQLASISYPQQGETVKDKIDIFGTAFTKEIDYYKIEYKEKKDNDWTEIVKEENVVIGEKLGTWDTTLVGNGDYDLKLTVKDKNGDEKETVVEKINTQSFSGRFRVKVPNRTSLGNIKVATYVQSLFGNVGNSTSNGISVEDDRGTRDGWSLTVTATDLYSGTALIPITNLTVDPSKLIVENGSGDHVSLGQSHTFTGENDPATVMIAEPGFGNGLYYSTLNLEFLIPANTKAGKYKAVMDFTLL